MAEKTELLKVMAFATNMMMESQPPEFRWRGAPLAKHWGRISDAIEQGAPVNWTSFCGSPEIFRAMGIPSIMQDEVGLFCAMFPGKLNEKYIDIAHEHLVADHVCSAQKIMIGATLCGDMPPPAMIVHAGQPCDSTLVTYSAISQYLGVPLLTLDIPGGRDERVVQYVADELERMVAFIEEHTGRKLEDDKLKEVMEYSNAAHEYSLKINELTKLVPCPLPRMLATPLMDSAGTPEALEMYRNLYEIGRAVVEIGTGYVPNQKIRAGLFSTWVSADVPLFDWLEQEFGVMVINTMLGTDTTRPTEDLSSRRKIMEGLARKQLNAPMGRECWAGIDHWFDYAVSTCREWKLDVVLMTLHIGCKNMWAVQKLFRDKIADELGIPVLIVEVDFFDGRVFSSEGIRAHISDFFNTMMA